jgi:predicted GIY-YIG superfamily endonuclease
MGYYLYKLTFSNGKCYIGQTIKSVEHRYKKHKNDMLRGSKLAVHCAWRKYGDPMVECIEVFDTHDDLHKAEIKTIQECKTMSPNGYNVGYGGETSPSLNPDVAKKIGDKVRGMKRTDEQKSEMSIRASGNWKKDGYREAVLAGVSAAWTEEARKTRGEMMRDIWKKRKESGWVMPESTREKLKSRVITDEWRRNNSESRKGVPKGSLSSATKEKISIANKAYWDENRDQASSRGCAISKALKRMHAEMTEDQRAEFMALRKKGGETRRKRNMERTEQ